MRLSSAKFIIRCDHSMESLGNDNITFSRFWCSVVNLVQILDTLSTAFCWVSQNISSRGKHFKSIRWLKHTSGIYNYISDAISRFLDEQIPSPSTSYKTGNNAMCDTPTADIDIIVSNEVDRLWDAVVSEQTAKTRPLSAIRSFV